jgi:preprotein translocase subunit YajC
VLGMLMLPVAATSGGSSGSTLGFLLPLLLMGGVFYFLLIRPQQRRQRSQRDLLSSLSVGDDVVTIGGVLGVIREMDDDEVTLEVAPNVDVRFIRSAIARKITYEDDTYEEIPEHEEEEAGGQP